MANAEQQDRPVARAASPFMKSKTLEHTPYGGPKSKMGLAISRRAADKIAPSQPQAAGHPPLLPNAQCLMPILSDRYG